jgi:hypothetical protein
VMSDDEFDIDELKRVLDEEAESFVDRAFRKMVHDACVTFGSDRVLDAVLAVLFMRIAGVAAAASFESDPFFDGYDYEGGYLDPVSYNGLPMRMNWDYFGSELFPGGRWSTRNWFRFVGVSYQSPDP